MNNVAHGLFFACVICLIVLAIANLLRSRLSKPKPSNRLIVAQSANTIYFSTLLLWPFIFNFLCATVGTSIYENIYLLVGFLWPVLLLLSRMALIDADHKPTKEEDRDRYQETRGTGALMFTAAFGVGILIGAIRGSQDRQGSKLILASLLLVVAFFIPTHLFDCGTTGSQVINVLQTCVLHVSIGIFMMGIILSYFSTK